MNRLERLTAILTHLQSKKVVKASEIAGRFKISLRTVYRDLRALEEAGVPVGAEAGIGFFLVDGYRLPPVMFTRDEASALVLAGALFHSFSDATVSRHFDSAMFKVKAVLQPPLKEHLETLSKKIEVWEPNTDESPAWLTDIQTALGEHRVIRMEYYSLKAKKAASRVVEPISLSFSEGAWYLFAWCRLRNDYREFRLDRILHLTLENETFSPEKHQSHIEVLEQMFDQNYVHPVTLHFHKNSGWETLKRRLCYCLVDEKDLGDTIELTFRVDNYFYFGKYLFGFGDQVNIVSPPELKEIMKEMTRDLADHYR